MNHVFFTDETGSLILSGPREAIRSGEPFAGRVVFRRSDVDPKVFNLLHASILLYQQLTYQFSALQLSIDLLDGFKGFEDVVTRITDAQNKLLAIQRAAIEGVDKVGAEHATPQPKGHEG